MEAGQGPERLHSAPIQQGDPQEVVWSPDLAMGRMTICPGLARTVLNFVAIPVSRPVSEN